MKKTNGIGVKRLSVVLYIVILCLFVTATFSWFIFDKTASISSDGNVQIMAGSRLEISVNANDKDAKWGHEFKFATDDKAYPDITGDGQNFYFPTSLDKQDKPFTGMADTFHYITSEDKSGYYIELTVTFRTTANTTVYLANNSYVLPASTEVNEDNKSMYGNFSRDGIAGAVRVAFIDNTAGSLKTVWIPNETYHLSYDGTSASFDKNGDPEESYGYFSVTNGTVEQYTYGPADYAGLVSVGTGMLAAPASETGPASVGGAKELLTFDGNGQMQQKSLTVRIWIEGTDREADKALAGGLMKYKFNFICIDKTENEGAANLEKIRLANNNLLAFDDESLNADTLKDTTEYSTDGITWTTYTGAELIFEEGTKAVYVRYKETNGAKPSAVKEILLNAA